MPAVVSRILPRTPIGSVVTRTPYALVRVERAPQPTFHRGMVDFFDGRFPSLFTFATLNRADFRPEALAEAFQTSLGPLRRGVVDGYYLFEVGLVVGHHGGETRPASVQYATGEPDFADDPVVQRLALTSPREADALRQLVAYFLPIVQRKQQASGYAEDPAARARRETPPPPPPSAPAPPVDHDAYAVLGVAATATDDEVKAAYREQLKLNHPDKVAHLSPALQQFAQQQTLRIKHAYETILALRGRAER